MTAINPAVLKFMLPASSATLLLDSFESQFHVCVSQTALSSGIKLMLVNGADAVNVHSTVTICPPVVTSI